MDERPEDPELAATEERWRALSDELDRMLELPEHDLRSWLEGLRQRDPASAARLERILAARQSDSFAAFLQESIGPASGLIERGSLCGRSVGPYLIDAEIGRGGMGSVWRAHRADGRFEGTVAIKFLHAFSLGGAGEQRFRAEGRLLARLSHAGIARLVDAGVLDGRDPYLVLEYVEGQPIDAYCQQHELGLAARIRLFLQVLAAVVHAHAHLVIHRDLKPSNILVTAEGTVKLLDFGVAKLLRNEEGGAALTETRVPALTPRYAAPEQVLGEPVTTATDVYALGLVLYELLTGCAAVTIEGRSATQLLHAVVSADPPRASLAALLPIIPSRALRGDLDNILGKALKKNPNERYPSVPALADDLERFLAHEPVTVRGDSFGYRARKFLRRRRGAVIGGAAVLAALIAGLGTALWQAHRASQERDGALQQARRNDLVGAFMSTLVADFSRSAGPGKQRAYLDRARELLAQRHYEDPLLQADLLNQLAARYEEFGYPDTAVDMMKEAEQALAHAGEPVSLAQVGCGLANLYDDLDREAEAEREIDAAMRTLDALGTDVRPQVKAECRLVQSYVETALRKNRAAVAAAHRALAELESAGLRSGAEHMTALNAVARAEARAGHNGIAVATLRQLRAGEGESGAPASIGAWIHEFNLATDLLAGGKVLGAMQLIDELQSTDQGGDSNAHDLKLLKARALLALGQGAAAAELLQSAPGDEIPAQRLRRTLLRIESQVASGKIDEARALWSGIRESAESSRAAGGPDAAQVLRIEALLRSKEDPADAQALLTRAATLSVDADGEPVDPSRSVQVLSAAIALEQGDLAQAERNVAQALLLAQKESVDEQSSAWIGEGLLLRARRARASGDLQLARSTAGLARVHLNANLGGAHPLTRLADELASAGAQPNPARAP